MNVTDESSTDDPMAAIAERMGPDNFARRNEIENGIRSGNKAAIKKIDPRSTGRWHHRFIRLALKLSLLEGRARRNCTAIQTHERDLRMTDLPLAFDGYRVLQITDLHIDMEPDLLLPPVLRAIEATKFDLAVFTGDYGNFESITKPNRKALREIIAAADAPRFGILGNHDPLRFAPKLECMGLAQLINESVPLERGGETLWLAGVDDPHFAGAPDLDHALREVPPDGCALLLAHAPNFAERAAQDPRVRAMLSGHTHGGQICLPGGRPLSYNCDCPPERASGAWQLDQIAGYTSRGTGSSGVFARLNCPPEITVHTLRAG